MGYQYDAYFSYKRDPQSDSWHQTVKQKLEYWLKTELGRDDVNIYFDTDDTLFGNKWKVKMGEALLASKCLIGVWSPLYRS